MNGLLKSMLHVSEISKWSGRLPLAREDKAGVNILMPCLVYPLKPELQPPGIRKYRQNLIHRLWLPVFSVCGCLFLLSASRFESTVLIQFP